MRFVFYGIAFVILMAVFYSLPTLVQVVILAANTAIPDPIPVVDEVLMSFSVFRKINNLRKAGQFVIKHQDIITAVFVAVVIGTVCLVLTVL